MNRGVADACHFDQFFSYFFGNNSGSLKQTETVFAAAGNAEFVFLDNMIRQIN